MNMQRGERQSREGWWLLGVLFGVESVVSSCLDLVLVLVSDLDLFIYFLLFRSYVWNRLCEFPFEWRSCCRSIKEAIKEAIKEEYCSRRRVDIRFISRLVSFVLFFSNAMRKRTIYSYCCRCLCLCLGFSLFLLLWC